MANPTNYYVDPAIAGNSGTGSIGDPFGDLQYALNTVTRNATNGDQFNIKAGTDEILTAALSLTTYGAPTEDAPLIFRGYTTTANDGGQGGISGAGSYSIIASATLDFIYFIDMHLHNSGSAPVVQLDNRCYFFQCEVDNTSGNGLQIGSSVVVLCKVHNCGGVGIYVTGGLALNNFLKNGANAFVSAITINASFSQVGSNIISIGGASIGVTVQNNIDVARIIGNSIYSNGGTGSGIFIGSGDSQVILNNIIEGFSGVGGVGISSSGGGELLLSGYNKLYNNATNADITSDIATDLGNTVLLASPFTNPAGDDFSVSTAVKATAYPSSFYGSSTNNYLDPGAAQRQEAGGGRRNRARYHGV